MTIVDHVTHLERALRVTPGASQTRSKAPTQFGPTYGYPCAAHDADVFPLFATGGSGAWLTDDRGRPFLDCFCANAAVTLGYAYSPVVDAVRDALGAGSLLSLPSVREAAVSELFLSTCARWAQQVRWLKTGSEATHAALRIAQAATGRRAYLRLRGSYHGWHSCWQESIADAPDARWISLHEGLDSAVFDNQLAALIIEPPRWEPLDAAWLRDAMARARTCGAVVVFDEMVYGLRWRRGGAAEFYGVTPDLACFGKALGNGVPVACVCGPADLMRHAVACVSGTYGGDVLGLAAAEAVLRTYQERDVIGELWANGTALWEAFAAADPPDGIALEGNAVHWRLATPGAAILDHLLLGAAARGVLAHRASNNASAAMTPADARHIGRMLGDAAREAV